MSTIVESYSEEDFTFNVREAGGSFKTVMGTTDDIFKVESAWFPTPKEACLDVLYDLFLYWARNEVDRRCNEK